MTIITKENFNKKCKEIKANISNCKFIAIDLEFSALQPLNTHSYSLFDTPNERYEKLRKQLEQVIPLQVGVTTFNFDPEDNVYSANMYTFYVLPGNFPGLNTSFYFQIGAINFLKLHSFDFNKFIYSGIPYLSRIQESLLQNILLNNGELSENDCTLKADLQNVLESCGEIVKKWYNKCKEGDKLIIPNILNKYSTEIVYFVHQSFRNRFKNVWTLEENNGFVVKFLSENDFKRIQNENASELNNKLATDLLGFTRVFRWISKSKKPIIGHNLFQDLAIMVNNFEEPLPSSYGEFKKLTNKVFPVIFDTKCIVHSVMKNVTEEKRCLNGSLQGFFEYFKDGVGRHLAARSPAIVLNGETDTGKYHEAGWDSFCTGYIFIRLAHYQAASQYPSSKNFMSSELIGAVLPFKGCINIIRGAVSHIKIDGDDPKSTRPPWLVIESCKNKPINISQVTSLLSCYGFVEVKQISSRGCRALVAVDNFGNARRILRNFKTNNKDFQIKQYNVLKHSPIIRTVMLSGITISGLMLIWLTHSAIKR